MSDATATRYRWEEMPREALGPLLGRRMITGERVMLAHVYLERGAVVPQACPRERTAQLPARGFAAVLAG